MKAANANKIGFAGLSLLTLFTIIVVYRDLGNVLINVDLTLLVLLTTALSGVFFISKLQFTKQVVNTLSVAVVAIMYMFITLAWTRSYSYGSQKILLFLPFILNTFFLNKLLIQHISIFRRILLLIAIYMGVYLLFNKEILLSNQYFRLEASEETNPIKLGKFFGFAILCAWFFLDDVKWGKIVRIGAFIGAVAMFSTVIILSGSKGPMFALISSWMIVRLLSSKHSAFTAIFLVCAVLIIFNFLPDLISVLPSDTQAFINRRFNLISDDTGSVSSRMEFIKYGLTHFSDRGMFYTLFGNGSGDFQYSAEASYPHNIFVEVLYELGFVGLTFLGLVCTFLFKNLKAYQVLDAESKFFSFSALYFLIIACTTGDISGNFLFLTFLILLYINHKKKKKTVSAHQEFAISHSQNY